MKSLNMVMIGVCLAAVAIAQEIPPASVPADIEVVKKSWRREVINLALGVDPNKVHDEYREAVRAQKQADEYNKKKPAGEPAVRPKSPTPKPNQLPPSGLIERFYYQAKIKNIGAKTIKSVVWEYVFFDPETRAELSRFQCTDKLKLGPGKSAELLMNSPTPPYSVIDVRKADKGQQQFIEQFVITRIEYSDGSIWQSSQN
jgi:hypothetical protein